jgi:FtsP/CotA-like multicopper oxidase with cupredoxin domain
MADIDFTRTGVAGEASFDNFGCNVWAYNPATPDIVRPDVRFVRQVHGGADVTMPDGRTVRFWSYRDPEANGPNGDKPFPSPIIRVRAGQVVHSTINAAKNTHTIHHHGVDPTPFNDGVGHLTFEVKGSYTYQFRPSYAGTYFYHCHKNTVLHFEMGMYGPLIVDPPEGPGTLYSGGPKYDVEAIWVADDVDPVWHELGHSAGLCGEDVNLDRFRPQYFMISGVPAPRTLTDPRVVIRAKPGQKILIRLINASYSVLKVSLGLDSTIVAADGRGLGCAESPWSKPIPLPKGAHHELTSAQRYDFIIEAPATPGTYPVRLAFHDWATDQIQAGGRGIAESRIIVA